MLNGLEAIAIFSIWVIPISLISTFYIHYYLQILDHISRNYPRLLLKEYGFEGGTLLDFHPDIIRKKSNFYIDLFCNKKLFLDKKLVESIIIFRGIYFVFIITFIVLIIIDIIL